MKHLEKLGLAVLAAMAVVAIAAAGSSPATELCTESISACPKPEPATTVIEATTSLMTLTNSSGSITCTHSVIKGKTTTAGGKGVDVEGTIESFTATGTGANGECTIDTAIDGKTHPCTVTGNNLPWKAVLTKSAQPSGTLTFSSSGKGEPGFTVSCPAMDVVCVLHASKIVLDWGGGSPAVLKASNEPFEVTPEGVHACIVQPTWDGTYTVLKPTAGYLVN
jgi:hypothetical protein